MFYKTEKNREKHFRIIQFGEKDFEKKIKPRLLKNAAAGLEPGCFPRTRRIAP